MDLKSTIRKTLFGLDIPNEYVCLDRSSFSNPLSVTAKIRGGSVDVSQSHILLGYKPLVLGIYFENSASRLEETVTIDFRSELSGTPLAQLTLKKIGEKNLGEQVIFIYEGVRGQHHFLNAAHQAINRMSESLRKRKSGNVGLPGNLYDQVRIAYSVPRTISVYSVGDGLRFNFFPTDLHGPVNDDFYAGSLRHEGIACRQVETFKRVTLSEVRPSAFRDVYSLGKNHMKEIASLQAFGLGVRPERSRNFGLPIPSMAMCTRELELFDTLDAGIHRLLFYKTISRTTFELGGALAHIHRYFAQWRTDHRQNADWLLR